MRKIEFYKGKEIDKDIITRIKEIAASRYATPIYDNCYRNVEDIDQLSHLHDTNIDDETLILGEDWFLCYRVSAEIVTFLEWVATDNRKNKTTQTLEMLEVLKNLFIQHKDKEFATWMRHDSSYPFYCRMKKSGFINEIINQVNIDYCNGALPERAQYLEYNYNCLEDFLESEEAKEHPEYLKFILHYQVWEVTDKFVNKYKGVQLIKKI